MVVEREIVVEEQEIIVVERFPHRTVPKHWSFFVILKLKFI
jgi:hypothetical protein